MVKQIQSYHRGNGRARFYAEEEAAHLIRTGHHPNIVGFLGIVHGHTVSCKHSIWVADWAIRDLLGRRSTARTWGKDPLRVRADAPSPRGKVGP